MSTPCEPARHDRPEWSGSMSHPDAVRCLQEVSVDLVELLHTRLDPDVVALGKWTVRDVAAHLAGLMGVYEAFVHGEVDDADSDVESAATRIARANALAVAGRDAMSFDDIVDEFEAAVRSLIDELGRHDPAEAISLWQARPGRPDVVAGLAVSELLVHGDDIAHAREATVAHPGRGGSRGLASTRLGVTVGARPGQGPGSGRLVGRAPPRRRNPLVPHP